MDIFVNGEKVTVQPGRGVRRHAPMTISYELVAELAELDGRMPTITWYAPSNATRGLLSPGQRAQLFEGMKFTAVVTGSA